MVRLSIILTDYFFIFYIMYFLHFTTMLTEKNWNVFYGTVINKNAFIYLTIKKAEKTKLRYIDYLYYAKILYFRNVIKLALTSPSFVL